ncbi:MAG: TIGR00266 family protein [Polyangiaceae bacterium]|nr:TIGR00266 family protein [Polyangiaceae bacterium]
MNFEIKYNPTHSMALAHLEAGESVRAEAAAMVGMTGNISVATTARHDGGFLGGLKRAALGGESFFQNTFTAASSPGHVALAPKLCGSMVTVPLSGGQELFIQGSSYVAAPESISLDTKFQGMKGFFSGESLFFLKASGQGEVLVNAFGAIEEYELDGELVVDTGHLVAFSSGIEYSISKASHGWISSFLSGEGLVLRMVGRGKLYLQSRNPSEYGKNIGHRLPPRQR